MINRIRYRFFHITPYMYISFRPGLILESRADTGCDMKKLYYILYYPTKRSNLSFIHFALCVLNDLDDEFHFILKYP